MILYKCKLHNCPFIGVQLWSSAFRCEPFWCQNHYFFRICLNSVVILTALCYNVLCGIISNYKDLFNRRDLQSVRQCKLGILQKVRGNIICTPNVSYHELSLKHLVSMSVMLQSCRDPLWYLNVMNGVYDTSEYMSTNLSQIEKMLFKSNGYLCH